MQEQARELSRRKRGSVAIPQRQVASPAGRAEMIVPGMAYTQHMGLCGRLVGWILLQMAGNNDLGHKVGQ
jgi:hypothetical protein